MLLVLNSLFAAGTGMARTLANEFWRHGITVNNLCPGYTLTDRARYIKDESIPVDDGGY